VASKMTLNQSSLQSEQEQNPFRWENCMRNFFTMNPGRNFCMEANNMDQQMLQIEAVAHGMAEVAQEEVAAHLHVVDLLDTTVDEVASPVVVDRVLTTTTITPRILTFHVKCASRRITLQPSVSTGLIKILFPVNILLQLQ
jgi:hypothetical protein